MCTGTFSPSPEAAGLTRAPHATRPSTPVTVRYSDASGIPTIPDNDPARSGPRGIGVRFHLVRDNKTSLKHGQKPDLALGLAEGSRGIDRYIGVQPLAHGRDGRKSRADFQRGSSKSSAGTVWSLAEVAQPRSKNARTDLTCR
jgi:hypothetical protein